MGPDEDKNYNDAIIKRLNPETGEWEEVGKLKDIKEINGDDKSSDKGDNRWFKASMGFKGSIKIDDRDVEYMVLPVQLHFDIKKGSYRYMPVQNNMVFYANDYDSVINGMIKRFGAVVKIIDHDRYRGLISNRSQNVDDTLSRLYGRNCENGHVWSVPKIIEVFEPISTKCKNYTLYFIIKVR